MSRQQAQPTGLLTIAELAQRHNLPESTARYYCKRFLAYLPHAGQGKRRRYLPAALETFTFIVNEMHHRKNAMTVEHSLQQRFGPPEHAKPAASEPADAAPALQQAATLAVIDNPDSITQGQAALFALLEQQSQAMERIAESLAVMNRKDASVSALEKALSQREGEVAELRREVGQLKTLLATSEKVHQQDLDQMRKWLSKMAATRTEKQGQA
ncbi:MerR family transcriptional regulator [Oleidesulfovibrio sp.]|uniref:MerR family transcriptional regulator n=1 Tax=Oleidesulfovibrio sp. TaxID=2909707 RepID=UPI003A836AC9